MTDDDVPMRSKQLELFGKMHVGMDHALAQLLQDAPRLPGSVKLQTETQSLHSTWLHVTETFEKRQAMLQRRREKEKSKSSKGKKRSDSGSRKTDSLDAMQPALDALRTRSSSDKLETTTSKKAAARALKVETDGATGKEASALSAHEHSLSAHEHSMLKKLRKLPLCGNVVHDTNKFRALVKWIEMDQGDNAAMSMELTTVLDKLQLENTALKKTLNPKLNRKRTLETRRDVLQMQTTTRSNSNAWTGECKRGPNQSRSFRNEKDGIGESPREKEMEASDGSSESDEAEFVPELHQSPPFPARPHKSGEMQPLKRQKQQTVQEVREQETALPMTSKEQLAAAVTKVRANETTSVTTTKYLSYEEKEQEPVKLGASPKFAIVVDDTEKEEDKEEEVQDEEEASVGQIEEISTEALEHDSSTDEDSGVFDLNEEDVFVVEAILCVKEGRVLLSAGGLRRHKESDLYLVKWEGYDELTWEPDENIPRRLIEMFRGRERAKRACQYQIKIAHERKEVTNLTTQAREIIYMIQWINQDLPMWEARATLPIKTQVWLDKVLGAAPAKKRRDTKVAKQSVD